MSWQCVQWVFQVNRSAKGTALNVLGVIAEAAGADGTGCTLSVKTIAERARTTERNVTRAITQLSSPEFNVLKVEPKAGKNGTNRIAVLMNEAAPESPGQLLHFRRTPRQGVIPDRVSPEPDSPGSALFGDDTLSPGHVVTLTTGAAGGDTLSAEPSLNRTSKSPSVDGGDGAARKRAAQRRGTRLPENWQPSRELIEWARGKGYPDDFQKWATERFKNYWLSATGRNATKLEWGRTWMNWLTEDLAKWQRGNRSHQQPAPPSAAEQWMNL